MERGIIRGSLTVGRGELGRRERPKAVLTEAVFPAEGYKLPSSKRLPGETEGLDVRKIGIFHHHISKTDEP